MIVKTSVSTSASGQPGASRVYEIPGGTSRVEGMPDDAGFLVTEEWLRVGTVVKTLGFYPERPRPCIAWPPRPRARQQLYRPVAPAA